MKYSEMIAKWDGFVMRLLDELESDWSKSKVFPENTLDLLTAVLANRAGFMDPTVYKGQFEPILPEKKISL